MNVLTGRNINETLLKGIDFFQDPTNFRVQESRNGVTFEALEPVTTVYERPWERVCLIKERDANPFFHFIEGLWMLAGREDLKPLTFFVKSMEDFSDDGETLHGAYGYRWRANFNFNQLTMIVNILRNNPDDRRCVLQMWSPVDDLGKITKDAPCNTNIYFKVRDNELDMTVCCRSNDMLWGAYGANVVHMSMLQEYMAYKIGVHPGRYRQISDSFHVYPNEVWKRVKHLKIDPMTFRDHWVNPYDKLKDYKYRSFASEPDSIRPCPHLDDELHIFFDSMLGTTYEWKSYAIRKIAKPMVMAYKAYKDNDIENSYRHVQEIEPVDWMLACFNWIKKRDKSGKVTLINKPKETI